MAKKNPKKTKDELLILKNKIKYLEEELVRKQKMIEELKQQNLLLFKTALKHSERRVDKKKIREAKKNLQS